MSLLDEARAIARQAWEHRVEPPARAPAGCPTCARPYAPEPPHGGGLCPICRARALAEIAGFDEAVRAYQLPEVHAGLVALAQWTSDPRARAEARRLAALLHPGSDHA